MTQAFHSDIAQPKGGRVMRRISQQDWENEHMHNPITEGEALTVDESLLWWLNDAANVMAEMGNDSHVPKLRQIHEALTAHTAASGWEAKGDRLAIRMLVAAGFITEAKANEALRIAHGFEHGPLAPPPAAVPADALERLVESWNRMALTANLTEGERAMLRNRQYELAALIPKGADHG